jgi:S-adenosyl-L-methionine hydrolase (adenosine-forming)
VTHRPILFVTDYGLDDEYVGICHAVVARVAPEARVIDITHGIPPQDVVAGAMVLASSVGYGPRGAVYLAVVDPGVGTERRALALRAGEALLVGPDNGLLWPASRALGGIDEAVAIEPSAVSEGPVSPTFHGRDVFAPAAALLSRGAALENLGVPIDRGSVLVLEPPETEVRPGEVQTSVLGVDRFGNVRLAARPEEIDRAGLGGEMVLIGEAGPEPVRRVRTFAEVAEGGFGLLEDSAGWLAVVRTGASAAEGLRLSPGDAVRLAARGDAIG